MRNPNLTKAQKKDGDQGRSAKSRRKENKDRTQSNQQQCKRVSTQIQQCKLLKESARLRGVLGQGSNLIIFVLDLWTVGISKHSINSPINLEI